MEKGRFNLLNGSRTYLRGRITNQWGAEEEENRFRINLVVMRAHGISTGLSMRCLFLAEMA